MQKDEVEQIMCRRCDKPMQVMPDQVCIRLQPRAICQCGNCFKRVLIYQAVKASAADSEASARPEMLKIWSDELTNRPNVSAYVEQRAGEKGLVILQ